MLSRVLEPELIDTDEDAHDYDAMDHAAVNTRIEPDLFLSLPDPAGEVCVLDVPTPTVCRFLARGTHAR